MTADGDEADSEPGASSKSLDLKAKCLRFPVISLVVVQIGFTRASGLMYALYLALGGNI